MSKEQGVTNWRCDRCGRRAEVPGNGVPVGWSIVERRPMGGTPEATDEYDVCDGCSTLVSRLLQPIDKPNNRDDVKRMIGSGGPLTEVELVRGYSSGSDKP